MAPLRLGALKCKSWVTFAFLVHHGLLPPMACEVVHNAVLRAARGRHDYAAWLGH